MSGGFGVQEGIEDSIASVSLEDEDDDSILMGVELSSEEISCVNCLVGVFLTSIFVHYQAMRSTLASVWHPIGGVSISNLVRERYLFRFYFEVDLDKVLKNGP